MTRELMIDRGQTLASPVGKVIGFLDGIVEFEAFADVLPAAGYSATAVTSLFGENGVHLLERLKQHSFFFADSEDSIIQTGIRELKLGHYAVAIEVTDRQQAVDIASLAKPHGGLGFAYFGTWVNEQLPI